MGKPTEIVVGDYNMGMRNVRLVVDASMAGARFMHAPPDGGAAEMRVGIMPSMSWGLVVGNMMHEAMEGTLDAMGLAYSPAIDYSQGTDSYTFIMTHPQMSEVAARVGVFVADCLPDLDKVYQKLTGGEE